MTTKLNDKQKDLILTIISDTESAEGSMGTQWHISGTDFHDVDIIGLLTRVYNENEYASPGTTLNQIRDIWIKRYNEGNRQKYINRDLINW